MLCFTMSFICSTNSCFYSVLGDKIRPLLHCQTLNDVNFCKHLEILFSNLKERFAETVLKIGFPQLIYSGVRKIMDILQCRFDINF